MSTVSFPDWENLGMKLWSCTQRLTFSLLVSVGRVEVKLEVNRLRASAGLQCIEVRVQLLQ